MRHLRERGDEMSEWYDFCGFIKWGDSQGTVATCHCSESCIFRSSDGHCGNIHANGPVNNEPKATPAPVVTPEPVMTRATGLETFVLTNDKGEEVTFRIQDHYAVIIAGDGSRYCNQDVARKVYASYLKDGYKVTVTVPLPLELAAAFLLAVHGEPKAGEQLFVDPHHRIETRNGEVGIYGERKWTKL